MAGSRDAGRGAGSELSSTEEGDHVSAKPRQEAAVALGHRGEKGSSDLRWSRGSGGRGGGSRSRLEADTRATKPAGARGWRSWQAGRGLAVDVGRGSHGEEEP